MKYRKLPVEIEAVVFTDNAEQLTILQEHMNQDLHLSYKDSKNPKLLITTLEGVMEASVGDYIIKGIKGEFYPCKPEIFLETYTAVIF